jgi:prepilin-type processing-associated H-X9-DG protein
MVFPVFARARESARKAVCLSNVKNIALAFQMYFADNNDTMPPDEHRVEVLEYFNTIPGGRAGRTPPCGNRPRQANPYLRIPVVLDEYIKNRDVWRCPSAKVENGATNIIPVQDWLKYLQDNEGSWGTGDPTFKVCSMCWPSGWGGAITDTILQDSYAVDPDTFDGVNKAFRQSIGTVYCSETKIFTSADPVSCVLCGDAGVLVDDFSAGLLAYPDICSLEGSNTVCACGVDWEIASDPSCCGDAAYNFAPNNGAFLANPELRKSLSRHLGGENIGFADGHAAWIHSTTILQKIRDGELTGPLGPDSLEAWGPTSVCDDGYFPATYPGIPTIF